MVHLILTISNIHYCHSTSLLSFTATLLMVSCKTLSLDSFQPLYHSVLLSALLTSHSYYSRPRGSERKRWSSGKSPFFHAYLDICFSGFYVWHGWFIGIESNFRPIQMHSILADFVTNRIASSLINTWLDYSTQYYTESPNRTLGACRLFRIQ